MDNEKELTNEELEDQDLLEVCGHCGSLHITVEKFSTKYCNNCGVVDFVEVITYEEYEKRNGIDV